MPPRKTKRARATSADSDDGSGTPQRPAKNTRITKSAAKPSSSTAQPSDANPVLPEASHRPGDPGSPESTSSDDFNDRWTAILPILKRLEISAKLFAPQTPKPLPDHFFEKIVLDSVEMSPGPETKEARQLAMDALAKDYAKGGVPLDSDSDDSDDETKGGPHGPFRPRKSKRPRSDEHFAESIWQLNRGIKAWVDKFIFPIPLPSSSSENASVERNMVHVLKKHPKLLEFADEVTLGSMNGEIWVQRLQDVPTCKAIVAGILAKAMENCVFSEDLYGASPSQHGTLEMLEGNMGDQGRDVNDFDRQIWMSSAVRALLHANPVPPGFDHCTRVLTLRLYTLLEPLVQLHDPNPPAPPTVPVYTNRKYPPPTAPELECIRALWQVVALTARVAVELASEPVVYDVMTEKLGRKFEEGSVAIANDQALQAILDEATEEERQKLEERRLITWLTVGLGLDVYRPGNGREGGEKWGYRVRTLVRPQVYATWRDGKWWNQVVSLKEWIGKQPS